MAKARAADVRLEKRSRQPKHQGIPGLLSEQVAQEVSLSCRGLVLGSDLLGTFMLYRCNHVCGSHRL